MKLFLASQAKHPDSLEKLKKFVGGFEGKSIAYIPTAVNGEKWEIWKEGESWKAVNTLGADVSLIQLEEYWNKPVWEEIKGKDIVWFAGGYPGYLLYWIRRTKLDKHMKEILDSGTVYVGSSAGSMVTGQDASLSEWYIGEEEPGAGVIPTLKLVDFDFYPHYQDDLHDQIEEKYNGFKMYLVKDGEAITVENEKIKVLGEERTIEKVLKL